MTDLAVELDADAAEQWVPQDTFGARLALVRQARRWNVSEAAKACRIAPATWAAWEDGASPRGFERVARQIADATRCDYRWLIAGGPLRSRCFSIIAGDGPELGQMAIPFDRPQLSTV